MNTPTAPADLNAAIATNLRNIRRMTEIQAETSTGHRWMRASDLANAMRDRGFTHWHPQTVSNIEHGFRRVTAAELITLARVLDVDVERLVAVEPRARSA